MAKKSRRSQEGFISENESNTAPDKDGEIKVHDHNYGTIPTPDLRKAHKVKLDGVVRTTVNLDESQTLTNKNIDGWENNIDNVVSTFPVEQVAHGFIVGEGIYHDGATWVKGQADDADTLAYFVIIEVVDVDNFRALDFGRIQVPAHGFTVGEYYFLSETTPGLPVPAIPNIGYSNPLFFVEDATILQVKLLRPDSVGAGVTLDQIDDVSVNSPADTEVLTWDQSLNGGLGLWVAAPSAGGSVINELNDVGDVSVPTPANNEVLTYNAGSGDWESAPSTFGIETSVSLDQLDDVSVPTPSNNEVLTYNSTSDLWEAAPGGAGGEVNTNTNAGAGEGTIAKTKVGSDTPLKTIKAGTNITVTNNTDEILIDSTAGGVSQFGVKTFIGTDIDCSLGDYFEKNITTNLNCTFSNNAVNSNDAQTIIFIASNTTGGSLDVFFPNSVLWSGFTPTTTVAAGTKSIYTFVMTNNQIYAAVVTDMS